MTVLLDTGLLFAASVRRDAHHQRAVTVLRELADEPTITTDHVVVETWSLINVRHGWTAAMDFWQALRATPVRVEPVVLVDLERAEAIAGEWSDQQFDIVDCTSFAVMERLGCRRVASFDNDFAVYRFGRNRQQAFEIIR